MIFSTKSERRGPGPVSIVASVILSLLLGMLLAAVYLVFKPVQIVAAEPADPALGAVYLVTGSRDSAKAEQWTRKRQMLAEGVVKDIAFNEAELNAWAASVIPDSEINLRPGAEAAFKSPGSDKPTVMLGRPNFRISGGALQVGIPAKVSVFGYSRRVVLQARGHFVPGKNGYVFAPDELYLGSLPVHLIPGLKPLIVQRLIAVENLPDDMMAGWERLSGVTVQGDSLHLSLP